jgi:hypothetical protein
MHKAIGEVLSITNPASRTHSADAAIAAEWDKRGRRKMADPEAASPPRRVAI